MDITPTQAYIKDRHKEHYDNHHKSLKDDETTLIIIRIPHRCPRCKGEDFKRYGFSANRIQVYKCNICHSKFTVLTNTIFDNHKLPISEWIEFLYNLFSYVTWIPETPNDEILKKRYFMV